MIDVLLSLFWCFFASATMWVLYVATGRLFINLFLWLTKQK